MRKPPCLGLVLRVRAVRPPDRKEGLKRHGEGQSEPINITATREDNLPSHEGKVERTPIPHCRQP